MTRSHVLLLVTAAMCTSNCSAPIADDTPTSAPRAVDPCVRQATVVGDEIRSDCSFSFYFNSRPQETPAHDIFIGFESGNGISTGSSRTSSRGRGTQSDSDEIVVSMNDSTNEITLTSSADGDVSLQLDAGEIDQVWVTTGTIGGPPRTQKLRCPGLAQFITDYSSGKYDEQPLPECSPSGTGFDVADETIGCFTCEAIGTWLDEDDVYRGMTDDDDGLSRIARAHILTEEMAQIQHNQAVGNPKRMEVIAGIVALAAVFRWSLDVGGFHAEFGADPSDAWSSEHR